MPQGFGSNTTVGSRREEGKEGRERGREGVAVQAWFGKSYGQKAGHMPIDNGFL